MTSGEVLESMGVCSQLKTKDRRVFGCPVGLVKPGSADLCSSVGELSHMWVVVVTSGAPQRAVCHQRHLHARQGPVMHQLHMARPDQQSVFAGPRPCPLETRCV